MNNEAKGFGWERWLHNLVLTQHMSGGIEENTKTSCRITGVPAENRTGHSQIQVRRFCRYTNLLDLRLQYIASSDKMISD